jgi:hypothetical protein
MRMDAIDELDLIVKAYEGLLLLPLGSKTRHRIEPSLAYLRDEIALRTDRSAESVQNEFEARAETWRMCQR